MVYYIPSFFRITSELIPGILINFYLFIFYLISNSNILLITIDVPRYYSFNCYSGPEDRYCYCKSEDSDAQGGCVLSTLT